MLLWNSTHPPTEIQQTHTHTHTHTHTEHTLQLAGWGYCRIKRVCKAFSGQIASAAVMSCIYDFPLTEILLMHNAKTPTSCDLHCYDIFTRLSSLFLTSSSFLSHSKPIRAAHLSLNYLHTIFTMTCFVCYPSNCPNNTRFTTGCTIWPWNNIPIFLSHITIYISSKAPL